MSLMWASTPMQRHQKFIACIASVRKAFRIVKVEFAKRLVTQLFRIGSRLSSPLKIPSSGVRRVCHRSGCIGFQTFLISRPLEAAGL